MVAVMLVSLIALTGCDPYGVPESPGTAQLEVRIDAEGGADIDLLVGGAPPRAELLALGRELGAVLPDGTAHPPRINSNGGGFPFVTVAVDNVYAPGPHPVVRIDARSAVEGLSASGIETVTIDVSGPFVATADRWRSAPDDHSRHHWHWASPSTDAAPVGELALRPSDWRSWKALSLTALCAMALIAGLAVSRRRRHWTAVTLGVSAVATSTAYIASAGAAQADNLGVAGHLHGNSLAAAANLGIPVLLAWPASLALIGAQIDAARRRSRNQQRP